MNEKFSKVIQEYIKCYELLEDTHIPKSDNFETVLRERIDDLIKDITNNSKLNTTQKESYQIAFYAARRKELTHFYKKSIGKEYKRAG